MKQQVEKGKNVHGRVRIVLEDEKGRVKYQEEGDNAITTWGKALLEWWAIYGRSSNTQLHSSYPYASALSPMSSREAGQHTVTHGNMDGYCSLPISTESSPATLGTFDGGMAQNLVLLNPQNAGLSRHGEAPNWPDDDITGWAVDQTTAAPKRGTVIRSDRLVTATKNKRVFSFPAGIGTGTITDIARVATNVVPQDQQPNLYAHFGYPGGFNSGDSLLQTASRPFGDNYFYNHVTSKVYQAFARTDAAGFTMRVFKYVKDNPDNPYPHFQRLPDVVIPPPIAGWTCSIWRFLFMNDDFALFVMWDGNSQHQFMRYNIATNAWTFPQAISGDRYRILRSYTFTPTGTETSDTDYVRVSTSSSSFPSNMVASYDGRYIYCFDCSQIRNTADTGNTSGKMKIDTETWSVVDRKQTSYSAASSSASQRAPYCHSWNTPSKFGWDNDPMNDLTGGRAAIDTPRPYLYYDGFDPEDIFVEGASPFATNQDAYDAYAIAPEQLGRARTIQYRPINPMCHLVTLANGEQVPYRWDQMHWLGQYFDDPWVVFTLRWGVFCQYHLETPIVKGPNDSLRIEYTFAPATAPPWAMGI